MSASFLPNGQLVTLFPKKHKKKYNEIQRHIGKVELDSQMKFNDVEFYK